MVDTRTAESTKAAARRGRCLTAPHQCRPRLSRDRWPTVAADACALGLRQAAKCHGVSHETVRQIVPRVEATASTVPSGYSPSRKSLALSVSQP